MNANLRNFALWVIIVLLLLALFTLFQNPGQRTTAQDISFSQLLNEVDQGRVRDVLIQGPEIHRHLYRWPQLPDLCAQRSHSGPAALWQRRLHHRAPATERRTVVRVAFWSPGFLSSHSSACGSSCRGRCRVPAARPRASARAATKNSTKQHGRVTFEDVAGVDEGEAESAGNHRISARPGEIPKIGRSYSARRVADRTTRDRQDAAGRPSPAKRSAILLHFGLATSSKCSSASAPVARTRSVRAGEEECPLHHLHR